MYIYRYGEPYAHFFEGTLEQALREAFHKPAKDVSHRMRYVPNVEENINFCDRVFVLEKITRNLFAPR